MLCNQRTMECYILKLLYRGWGCCLVLCELRAYCVLDPEFSTQHLRSNSKASYKAPIQNIQTIKKNLSMYKPKISFVFFNLAPRSKRLSGPRGLKKKETQKALNILNFQLN